MYSQNQEEAVICEYFQNRRGNFLDLGANDGETLSNTRQLALQGWSGTLVEMVPFCIEKMRQLYENRTDIQILDTAVGFEDGETFMYESGHHLSKNDRGLLSTIVESELARWKSRPSETFEKKKVQQISVDTLVTKLMFDTYQFVSIDIEGMDFDILSQLDLSSLKCEMVCVEFNGKKPEKYQEFCAQHQLFEVHRNPENLIFAKS